MSQRSYTVEELVAAAISRTFRDGEVGFTGLATGGRTAELIVGVPMLAVGLAQMTHAPNLSYLLSGWILNPKWDETPTREYVTEFEDRFLGWGATAHIGIEEITSMTKRGKIDFGFMSGAQIDKYGNVNSVCIGDYYRPKVRLVGNIFLQEHMGCAFGREYIMMKHEKRRFVEKVDFISGVGFLTGPGSREKAGLKRGRPYMVATDLAILGFDERTKLMKLISTHPGVTVDQVKENTGFELIIPPEVPETSPPTPKEVELMRKVDPHGMLIHSR